MQPSNVLKRATRFGLGLIAFFTLLLVGCGGGSSSSPPATFVQLNRNDTGITTSQCNEAGSYILVDCGSAGAIALNNVQDGMVGRDANAATNSNTDGKLGFSFTSVIGGCVQDNVTGLMWEIKTADGGLRDWNRTYTNYTAAYNPRNLYGTANDASGFVNAVNATNLCGHSDWRLPTAEELQSIVDYGVAMPGPTVDTTWFPNTQGGVPYCGTNSTPPFGEFWSSSPSGTSDAEIVNFCSGFISSSQGVDPCLYTSCYIGGRGQPKSVRLVRGGQLVAG